MRPSNPLWTLLRLMLVTVSLALYVAALTPDALVFAARVYTGLDALREGALGLATLSLAGLVWAANIPLWLAWLTLAAGSRKWSAWLTGIAAVLGLLIFTLFNVDQPIHGPFEPAEKLVELGQGAYYWLASIGIALAGGIVVYVGGRTAHSKLPSG